MMNTLASDVRPALRSLRQRPAFTVAAILRVSGKGVVSRASGARMRHTLMVVELT